MNPKHAIVIGAGAAGTLSAKVLSRHFEKVTLLERDAGSSGPEPRRGIPQGRHVHNLLYGGILGIEEIFPGFFGENFDTEGSPRVEIAKEQRMLGPFGWNPTYSTGRYLRGTSRALLDRQLIEHVSRTGNVRLLFGSEVQGLSYDPIEKRVNGVRLGSGCIPADLVVDASGRASRLPRWLAELGVDAPETKRVKMTEGYASRVFAFQGELPSWSQFAVLRCPPVRTRGAYLLAIEKGRWIVTLVGGDGDYPPADDEGFLEFAKSLDVPSVHDFITHALPEGAGFVFRNMDSVCLYLDRVAHWPKGLIALGDAVCTFNPVFGQGITTAAAGAKLLDRMLARARPNPAGLDERRFHKKLIDLMASPWFYSVREEIRGSSTTAHGARWRKACRLWALRTFYKAVPKDASIHFRLFEVQSLLRPIRSLFGPLLLMRAWIVGRWGAAPPAPTDLRIGPRASLPGLKKSA